MAEIFDSNTFLKLLENTRKKLLKEMTNKPFKSASNFERRVREVISDELHLIDDPVSVNFNSHSQAFPDICLEKFGIEVKYTEKNTWRGIANSVSQGMKDPNVDRIFVLWCKEGSPNPDIKFRPYEEVVMHVRTSHVPRFEIDMTTSQNLFDQFKTTYKQFTNFEMSEKMDLIRSYAKSRIANGSNIFYWWLESQIVDANNKRTLLLFNELTYEEQEELALEEIFLFSDLLNSSTGWGKCFDIRVNYFLNKKRVLYPQKLLLYPWSNDLEELSTKQLITKPLENESLSIKVFNKIEPNHFRVYASWWKNNFAPSFIDWKKYHFS